MGVSTGEEIEKGQPGLREIQKHIKGVGSENSAGEDRRVEGDARGWDAEGKIRYSKI